MPPVFTLTGISLSLPDIVAAAWFVAAWISYSVFADYHKGSQDNLVTVMYRHRLAWMEQMVQRENRMVDSSAAGNIMSNVTFFASTSMFILVGLMTLLGNAEKGVSLIHHLPLATDTSPQLWDLKVLLLMGIFTYCFFKHTWALRQYNYTSILIAGAPVFKQLTPESEKYTVRAAKVLAIAAKNFNMGLRGYYFGLAALTWFLHPLLFMATTLWVVLVLYRREMHSKTLKILME